MSSANEVRHPDVPEDPPDEVIEGPEPPDEDGSEEFDDTGAFAYFTLEGDRFDAPGLPVANASEAGAFRDALIEMARNAWLRVNPDRVRVPGHFERNLDLRLIAIKTGSARLQLRLHRPSEQTDDEWGPLRSAYTQGRDDLTAALADFSLSGVLPPDFPPKALRAVRGIGATLSEDERIVLGSPSEPGNRVGVDQSFRSLLRDIDDALAPAAPVEAILTGVLIEFDGQQGSFQIRTETGGYTCRLEAGNAAIAKRVHDLIALDGITAPDVVITGQTHDPSARKIQLFNVHEVQVVRSVAEKVVVQRLRLLGALQPGWDGPDSSSPTAEVLQRVEDLAPVVSTLGLPVTIVANGDGAVVLEWRRGSSECTAVVDSDGTMHLNADNVDTDEAREHDGPYDSTVLTAFLQTGALP